MTDPGFSVECTFYNRSLNDGTPRREKGHRETIMATYATVGKSVWRQSEWSKRILHLSPLFSTQKELEQWLKNPRWT